MPYYYNFTPTQTSTIRYVPMQGLVTPFGGVTTLPATPPTNGQLIGGDLYASMMAARPIVIFSGGGGGGGAPAKKTTTTTAPSAKPTTPPAKPAPTGDAATTTTTPPAKPVETPVTPDRGTIQVRPVKPRQYVYYNPFDKSVYTHDYDTLQNKRLGPLSQYTLTPDNMLFDPNSNDAVNGSFLGYLKPMNTHRSNEPIPGYTQLDARKEMEGAQQHPLPNTRGVASPAAGRQPAKPASAPFVLPDSQLPMTIDMYNRSRQQYRDIERRTWDAHDTAWMRNRNNGLTDPISTEPLSKDAADPIAEATNVELNGIQFPWRSGPASVGWNRGYAIPSTLPRGSGYMPTIDQLTRENLRAQMARYMPVF